MIDQKYIDTAHKIIEKMPRVQVEGQFEEKHIQWLDNLVEALWDNLRAYRAGLGWDEYPKTTIKSPVLVCLPRKTKEPRKCALNLNNYRNWQPHMSNDIKIQYADVMTDQLRGLRFKTPIELKYTYFKASNRTSDRSNVIAVVDKFFCDALVHHGCIPDDNDNYIRASHAYSGGVDKENPRVEIEILEAIDTPANAC